MSKEKVLLIDEGGSLAGLAVGLANGMDAGYSFVLHGSPSCDPAALAEGHAAWSAVLVDCTVMDDPARTVRLVCSKVPGVPVIAVCGTASGVAELMDAGAYEVVSACPDGEALVLYALGRAVEVRKLRAAKDRLDKVVSQVREMERYSVLGRMVSGIAHDINNPLTGISGYSELLLMQEHDGRTHDFIKKIYESAQRCRKIIINLLNFSRAHKPHIAQTDINDLLSGAVSLRAYELRNAGITVEENYDDGVPLVSADACQLRHAFMDLLIALETFFEPASEEGCGSGGGLIIETMPSEDGGRGVLVRVSLSGDKQRAARLVEMVSPSCTGCYEDIYGSPALLGLEICRDIVLAHNGVMNAGTVDGLTILSINIPAEGGRSMDKNSGGR
ncbi:MAG TPA: histidine kinase dimerization/phospho-acceptor domain-containing protein [Nitrospirota bacterium]